MFCVGMLDPVSYRYPRPRKMRASIRAVVNMDQVPAGDMVIPVKGTVHPAGSLSRRNVPTAVGVRMARSCRLIIDRRSLKTIGKFVHHPVLESSRCARVTGVGFLHHLGYPAKILGYILQWRVVTESSIRDQTPLFDVEESSDLHHLDKITKRLVGTTATSSTRDQVCRRIHAVTALNAEY
jgi:hypothetical protein